VAYVLDFIRIREFENPLAARCPDFPTSLA
jgi:hypothetical protein